jgi:hypothetical protein
MPLGDIGGILRGLSSQVSVVRLTPQEEERVKDLVREIKEILDAAAKKTA